MADEHAAEDSNSRVIPRQVEDEVRSSYLTYAMCRSSSAARCPMPATASSRYTAASCTP